MRTTPLSHSPGAPPEDAELAARLRLVITRLARRLRRQTEGGVTASQLSALATVERAGPLTLGELSACERVQPPSMTRIVAGLEELELVARTVDTADRRVAHVQLTDVGRRLLDASRHRKNVYLTARLGGLDKRERATLAEAAAILERMLEEPE